MDHTKKTLEISEKLGEIILEEIKRLSVAPQEKAMILLAALATCSARFMASIEFVNDDAAEEVIKKYIEIMARSVKKFKDALDADIVDINK